MAPTRRPDSATLDVIAPNLKRRYSGVTSTVMRLVPLQAREIAIATIGPRLPEDVPRIGLREVLTLPRDRPRVWHARRNVEMLAGLVLRHGLRRNLRLLFTSAAQRRHTAYTDWLIARMDRVIATSSRAAGFLHRDAEVIRHGIDITGFAPPADRNALREALGLPGGTLVGCYGRVRPQKGTDRFVEAMISLLPERPGVTALVMGGVTSPFRDFAEGLKTRVAEAGLEGRILFRPEAPGFTIAPWFQALDLYVAPQRNEGFGLTPLEAMACGVPVVATDAGAFAELVAPEETGLVVPAGDDAALCDVIARALDDAAARGRWAAAAPGHVAARFRIEDEAAALIRVYREMLGRAGVR